MCTVTFVARRRGYALGMNRDEQRSRAPGLPPAVHPAGPLRSLHPSEPTGGAWVGVNSLGVSFALLNWYSVPNRPHDRPASRGTIVPALLATASPGDALRALHRLPLDATPPFRLIGVFPATREVLEWSWNQISLAHQHHPWQTAVWISSGSDEPGAQHHRGAVFREACGQASAGTAAWLRRLHRSHQPRPGPYSICMHREEAVTVSYTEITVSGGLARMRHLQGSPCRAPLPHWVVSSLDLHPNASIPAAPPPRLITTRPEPAATRPSPPRSAPAGCRPPAPDGSRSCP